MNAKRRALQLIVLALLAAVPAAADTHPNLARGFAADKAFQTGDVDSVNLFNGNLVIALPVGGSYPVGGRLSYGLTVVFNSNPWNFVEREDPGITYQQARANTRANAGFGWTLSLGRLESGVTAPNTTGRWLYIAPDGSEHPFFSTLHENETPNIDVWYSRDSTYMRLKKVGAAPPPAPQGTTIYEIEMANGDVHRFHIFGNQGSEVVRISDRFGNKLDVVYNTSSTQITDSQQRVQTINFIGSGTSRRVSTVVLTAFGNTSATYTFGYTQASLAYPCPHNDPQFPGPLGVWLLTSISEPQPDGSSFSIPEYNLDQSAGCRTPGSVKSLVLPTRAKVGYTYRDYVFPTEGRYARDRSNGVASRTLYTAAGTQVGQPWQYETQLNGVVEVKNTVTTPLGHKSEHFFSVSTDFSGTSWNVHEYGLPLTHNVADATAARFLSTREYGAGDVLLRSSYVRYERDNGAFSDITDATKLDQRLASRRVVYEDDTVAGSPQGGKRFADDNFSDFDGLGHYRTKATAGNFGAADQLSSYTRYNNARGTYPNAFTMWPVGSDWILETFDIAETAGPQALARRTFKFDSTGWLSLTRTHASSTGAVGTSDLIAETIHDGHGNLLSERYYGGDLQSVSTAPLTSIALPSQPRYRIDHTTVYGSRATSQYVNPAGAPLSFKTLDCGDDPTTPADDPGIDKWTGLAAKCRDTAGISTSYEYDPMGRLRFVKPESGHDAWTEYVYTPATSASSLAQVHVYRRENGGGSTLAESLVKYDAFGRPWQEQQKMASGNWSTRETLYNAMGWKTSVSELGNTAKKTQYQGYDRYGRPGTVQLPDAGHDVNLVYVGVRSAARRVKVGNTYSGGVVNEANAWTTELFDRQGQLEQVKEEAEANSTNTTTTYTYDPMQRLTRVKQETSAGTQNRFFNYDQRGFLLSEIHPEKGASGNGVVHYYDYDARGHVGRKVDGPYDLTFVYDAAERVATISETGAQGRTLKSFTYGDSNAPSLRNNGKLLTATRYNYISAPINVTAQVDETYTYAGRQGRVSRRNTQHDAANAVRSFVQTWTYTELGKVANLGYPECTFSACTDNFATARTVSHTYTNGWLTAVPGFAPSITYHSNGQSNEIVHQNGTTDTVALDPSSIPRPAAISTRRNLYDFGLWSTGNYSYDGAGNVTRMGAGYFLYDHVNRILDGHVDDKALGGGNLRSQTYVYDPFGNLNTIGGDPWAPGRSTTTSAATNRLSGASYDAAGNMVAWNGNAYEHDAFGLMTRVDMGNDTDWRYTYTAGDERIFEFEGGTAANWALRDLDGKVLREFREYEAWKPREYVYRDGQLLASEGGPMSFTDVPANHQYGAEIEAMKAGGVTSGCTASTYCPDINVTRGQMAVFLNTARGIFFTAGGSAHCAANGFPIPPFSDVPDDHPFCAYIAQIKAEQITAGCGVDTYCPELTVTTGQMAVFVTRALGITPPACVAGEPRVFSDVPASHNFCPFVEEVHRRGINNGCGNGMFCMETLVTRGAMAPLLARGFSLPYPDKGYTRHYHLDHLGTPRLVTSNATSPLAFHLYFPFGEEVGTSQDADQMKFTGHERDSLNTASVADDLDYMHARHYSPLTARFLSVDPAGGNRKEPQSWNRYPYAKNRPLRLVDQDGRTAFPFELAMFAARTVVAARDFVGGLVGAARQHTGQIPGKVPSSTAGKMGQATGNFLATHDTVVEGSVTVGKGTAGVAVVNATDAYAFGGVTHSHFTLSPPVSVSFSSGLVYNYTGEGSYGGIFGGVTTSSPLGISVATNPQQPEQNAMSVAVTFSSSVGGPSVSYTDYFALTELSAGLQAFALGGGGYTFVDGQVVRVYAPQ